MKRVKKKQRKGAGQIVNRSCSGGMAVKEYWVILFQKNETLWKNKKRKTILTDSQLTAAMLKAFPDRTWSKIMYHVAKVRGRYNRGMCTNGVVPKVQSKRYRRDSKGKVHRFDPWGREIK